MDIQLDLFGHPSNNEKKIKKEKRSGKPRLNSPCRNQLEMSLTCIDDLLPMEHLARDVWNYTERLDLSVVLNQIQAVEGKSGRSHNDPKVYLALWLYATMKGISSARALEEYCVEHKAFIWLRGGVSVNYHSLSDFRSSQGEMLDELLTQSIAILADKNIISLEEISQDGMRVRANAGGSSFKRKETLQTNLELANMLVTDLKEEASKNPGACRKRVEATQIRCAEEKAKNIENALAELEKMRRNKIEAGKKDRKKVKEEVLEQTRASMTDPTARIMKMACGGFRPAYNVQFATTNQGKAIVGVDVTNQGTDKNITLTMIKQMENKYNCIPKKWFQDGGYNSLEEVEKVGRNYKACKIFMPVMESKRNKDNLHTRLPTDSEVVGEWRERMGTAEAKEMYKDRAETAEYANAQARNRGMQQFRVRGLPKVQAVALMFALTHNMIIALNAGIYY